MLRKGFEFKVFNATFNNISVISWWSVLLVEDLEKTTDLLEVADKLSHNVVLSTPHHEPGSNYHTTTTPLRKDKQFLLH